MRGVEKGKKSCDKNNNDNQLQNIEQGFVEIFQASSNEVKSFARNIFNEEYIERGEALRLKMRSPQVVKLYRELLQGMEAEATKQMKALSERFEAELDGRNLSPDDLKNGSRGIGSYFRKLRDGKLSDKDVLNATLQNCLADAANWATKTSSRKGDIIRLEAGDFVPADARLLKSTSLKSEESGEVFLLQSFPFYIGNHKGLNQLTIYDNTVSREHAVIERGPEPETFFLRDLQSTNGTWVNQVRVESGAVMLKDGDSIRFASHTYRFRMQEML